MSTHTHTHTFTHTCTVMSRHEHLGDLIKQKVVCCPPGEADMALYGRSAISSALLKASTDFVQGVSSDRWRAKRSSVPRLMAWDLHRTEGVHQSTVAFVDTCMKIRVHLACARRIGLVTVVRFHTRSSRIGLVTVVRFHTRSSRIGLVTVVRFHTRSSRIG